MICSTKVYQQTTDGDDPRAVQCSCRLAGGNALMVLSMKHVYAARTRATAPHSHLVMSKHLYHLSGTCILVCWLMNLLMYHVLNASAFVLLALDD